MVQTRLLALRRGHMLPQRRPTTGGPAFTPAGSCGTREPTRHTERDNESAKARPLKELVLSNVSDPENSGGNERSRSGPEDAGFRGDRIPPRNLTSVA